MLQRNACATIQCLRPVDVQILIDESASITDANWAEGKEFIRRYAIALNGGKTGTRLGLGNDQVRISVIHWSDDGQQTMGIPFRQTTSLAAFVAHLTGLTRQYIGLGCPGRALKWTTYYSLCATMHTFCHNIMPMSALVHATQGPQQPPTITNPETGVIGVAPDSGAIATASTTTKQMASLNRRRAQLTKTSVTQLSATATVKPVLTATECCLTCYEGKACGNGCIAKDAACEVKILGGCACDVVSPTTDPAFLYKAGTYILSKQGLAAVRTPPTTGGSTSSGGQYTSCGCIPIADPTNCILFMTDLSLVAGKSQTCKTVCEMRTDTNKECGYTYAEYSAELGFRSDAEGGATVVVMATDGNPAPAADCSYTEASRTGTIAYVKSNIDRMIPIGVGPHVDVGTLLTLSKGMPASMPYVTTSFGSMTSALDVLATLSCPTRAPTLPPTLAPTRVPTTAKPTRKPTHAGGCTDAERAVCGSPGNAQSMCMCADALCTQKKCGCNKGYACSTGACTTCTAAPTRVPTDAPTKQPTKVPTDAPTLVPTDSPTLKPTYAPSLAPTKSPTKVPTDAPTRTPTFSVSCSTAQRATCDSANGLCSVDTSGGVHCACGDGYGCTNAGCGTCTAAPTLVPTDAPTKQPTKVPTDAPTLVPTDSPTLKPTYGPSLAPTGFPTETPTFEPTMMPTFKFVCTAAEKAGCDSAVGTCYCSDAQCTAKKCGCPENWGCTDAGCGTCTAAPTLAPTETPTGAPTTGPTAGPTN